MKKLFTLVLLLSIAYQGYSQNSLPMDFESGTISFIDFSGGTATVIPNPQPSGINTSATVAQIVRNGGEIWAGSKLHLEEKIDFSTVNAITMKVLSNRADVPVKIKLEGDAVCEVSVNTTVANEWETLTWDFYGEPADTYIDVVFMFDYENVGDGSANSTFQFDDIELIDQTGGRSQIDLPVDFESETVYYEMTDFGGNSTVLGVDPVDADNTVAVTTKTAGAETWAGTTIGTNFGFATAIPFSETETMMSVNVYSPLSGIQVRLKAEDHRDPTLTVETEATTTVSNAWETLVFDMSDVALGTNPYNPATNFDMLSIFFNFGQIGTDNVYYFDSVVFISDGLPQAENLALNKTAVASSEMQPAGNAVDGNNVTRWESVFSDPQWISVDLGQSYEIGQVVLDWETAHGNQYQIQVSDDNSNWTTIYDETNGDGGTDDIQLTGNGRYIRMYGTSRGTEWGYSLYEFEVYGPMDPLTNATLSDLQIDAATIDGFSPSLLSYVVELPEGTSSVPTVTATTAEEGANAVVNDAVSLPGTTTVVVTAEDLTTIVTYHILFALQPSAAPSPTINEANVISVYSDAFSANIATNLNPAWGQSTVFSEIQIDGNNTLKYAGLNYQGIDYTSVDVSKLEYVHLDYFTNDASALEFYLIAGGENYYDIEAELGITPGEWVSVDIPLSYYSAAGRDLSAAYQFKTTGNGTVFLDNLYFWSSSPLGLEEAEKAEISLYPNPATDIVRLEADSYIKFVEIFDKTGRRILTKELNFNSGILDVSTLNAGIYILRINAENSSQTIKLLKQ